MAWVDGRVDLAFLLASADQVREEGFHIPLIVGKYFVYIRMNIAKLRGTLGEITAHFAGVMCNVIENAIEE